jgi:hypothetical protein
VWNLWNWEDISRRFDLARKVDLGLPSTASGLEESAQ